MYFQRDYILRMIEMLGELVRRIGEMMEAADGYAELEEIANRACGLPLKMLRDGELDTMTGLLDEPQRYLAAELLQIAAMIDARTEPDDALLPTYAQALALLATLHEPDYLLPACDNAARIVREHFTQLPLESFLGAATLFERGGRYADAEDAWWAVHARDASLRADLLSFYDRLGAVDPQRLLDGGLTAEELDEGRAALN